MQLSKEHYIRAYNLAVKRECENCGADKTSCKGGEKHLCCKAKSTYEKLVDVMQLGFDVVPFPIKQSGYR